MLKVSLFRGETDAGPTVIPLFNRATDAALEKVASAQLLPEVVRYIDSLRPSKDAVYNLVNAMGAGEFFGSNINGDYFPEAALIHRPDEWTGNPLLDKIRAKDWAYGYPTFYFAHPYAHHRNKDAARAFGEVELSVWNDKMKRVELVTRVDKTKCHEFGGVQVWDKLIAGQFPDVSMGCKVPFDTCSICLDWKLYREAQSTFDSKKHKHPGEAVLAYHRGTKKIRGLSITRADYCDHAKKQMNKILPDGKKVFVYNDYPKFFDISFVFIGADRTAKVMMKIASSNGFWDVGSSVEMAEKLGYSEEPEGQEKSAATSLSRRIERMNARLSDDDVLAQAFGKSAKAKKSEIIKDVVPSQFAGKAVGSLTAAESDLPRAVLDTLGRVPLETALSSTGALGIVLRPREFQRIVLTNLGQGDMANVLDECGGVFPTVSERSPMQLGIDQVLPALVRLLLPLFAGRSALAPSIEHRVLVLSGGPRLEKKGSSSLSSPLLRKIAAAYNSYRDQLMDLVAHSQDILGEISSPSEGSFRKIAAASPEDVFSPLSVSYLETAFLDEVGSGGASIKQAKAGVERGSPSRNT